MPQQLSQITATQKIFISLATDLLMQETRPIELYKQELLMKFEK